MRFDPTGMTQAEIDSLSEAYNQMVMGNQPTKPQTANYIADAGEPIPFEPEFVPPQDSTGALGINPDTGDTFLPDSQPQIGDPIPPGFLDGLISDDAGFFGGQGPGQPPTFRPPPSLSPFGNSIRPQQQFNPYGGGFGGGFPPRNPYGTGGIGGFFSQLAQLSPEQYDMGMNRFQQFNQQFNQQPSYGGGFGGQRFQPPMMPQQQFNPYGGGFGGQRFQPPRMPQQQFNPYGGGFGGQRFQPPMMPQQQFNQFGGGFGGFNQAPNPFGGSFNSPLRQFMNPQILPFNMQPMTGTTPPQQPSTLNSPSGVGLVTTRMAAPGTNMATGQAPEETRII